MKLLHKTPILVCSDLEEVIHQAEVERMTEMLFSLPNYDCEITVTFEDDYHKVMNLPLFYESNLHRVFEFLEERDIKNGVDSFLTDDGDLVFRAYGQGYSYKGKHDIIKEQVLFKAFDQEGKQVDFTPVLSRLHQPGLENKKEATL